MVLLLRGTCLIIERTPLGPSRITRPRVLGGVLGGWAFSYVRYPCRVLGGGRFLMSEVAQLTPLHTHTRAAHHQLKMSSRSIFGRTARGTLRRVSWWRMWGEWCCRAPAPTPPPAPFAASGVRCASLAFCVWGLGVCVRDLGGRPAVRSPASPGVAFGV